MFRTDDLALATVLNLHNVPHCRLEMDGEGAEWLFEDASEAARLSHEFSAGRVRVEPRRFMRELRTVRDELYQFLDDSRAA